MFRCRHRQDGWLSRRRVTVRACRSYIEDCIGAVKGFAGLGEVHTAGDQMLSGFLDDPSGAGSPDCQRGRVSEKRRLVEEVCGVGIGLLARYLCVPGGRDSPADSGGDATGVAVRHAERLVRYPVPRNSFALGEEVVTSHWRCKKSTKTAPVSLMVDDLCDTDTGRVPGKGLGRSMENTIRRDANATLDDVSVNGALRRKSG